MKIIRKIQKEEEFIVEIKEINLQEIAKKIKDLWEFSDEKVCDQTTLLSRLASIMTLEISEGFFADKVVLVEGLEDKAVLIAYNQECIKKDFNEYGIAVIPVLGKSNMDRLILIFQDLNIPIYIIFDTDSDKKGDELKKQEKINNVLRKIMGDIEIKNTFEEKIEKSWASINPNMTSFIYKCVDEKNYETFLNELKEKYQFEKIDDCRKNYIVMKEFLKICIAKDIKFPIFEKIIDNIYKL